MKFLAEPPLEIWLISEEILAEPPLGDLTDCRSNFDRTPLGDFTDCRWNFDRTSPRKWTLEKNFSAEPPLEKDDQRKKNGRASLQEHSRIGNKSWRFKERLGWGGRLVPNLDRVRKHATKTHSSWQWKKTVFSVTRSYRGLEGNLARELGKGGKGIEAGKRGAIYSQEMGRLSARKKSWRKWISSSGHESRQRRWDVFGIFCGICGQWKESFHMGCLLFLSMVWLPVTSSVV